MTDPSFAPRNEPPVGTSRAVGALRTLAIVVGVIAALAGGVAFLAKVAFPRRPIAVHVVTVSEGPVRDVVTSSTAGEVAAAHHATVRAELGARVTAVHRRRGDRVQRGDPVVEVDATDLTARRAQARAALAAASAAVVQARERVATVERQAARARLLAERGAAGSSMAEDAEALLREARQALRSQQVAVQQAEAALRVAAVAVDHTRLTAPFDGLLVEVTPEPGDELVPGAPAFEIIDDGELHVEASIDEADAARIRLGQEAALTLDALPGRRIPGRLTHIAPAVRKDLKGARTLPIEVSVADVKAAMAAGLRAGMSANVEVVVAEKTNVPWLPTNAIVGRGVRRTVFVVEKGMARSIPVEVGLSNWERSEIVSGVKRGDVVVATLNAKGLEDRAPVRVEP